MPTRGLANIRRARQMLEAAFEMPHTIGIEISEETATPRGPSNLPFVQER